MMRCYLIIVVTVLLKTSMLLGAFWWMDAKESYPSVKVYFKDAEGVDWRIQSRLAESLFIVAPVKDVTEGDDLSDAKTFYLIEC